MATWIDDEARAEAVRDTADMMFLTLNELPPSDWGAAIGAMLATVLEIRNDAQDMATEEAAIRREKGQKENRPRPL